MAYRFLLPDLGEGLAEAEIVQWLVAVGDTVTADQPVAEVQTAKANVEIPSPVAGRVAMLGAEIGQMLDVGAVLIAFETADEIDSSSVAPVTSEQPEAQLGVEARATSGPTPPTEAEEASPVAAVPPVATSGKRRVLASPSTRKFAVQHDVDLATVAGTGPAGRVTFDDVGSFLSAPTAPGSEAAALADRTTPRLAPLPARARPRHAPSNDEVLPLRGIRREVARSMTRAWQEIPHVTEFREVDATRLLRAHRALRERAPADAPTLTLLPLLVLATASALRRHRVMNATIDMESELITLKGKINIGIATSSDAGLVVPVLQDVGSMGLTQISREIAELVEAVRDRLVRPEQLAGGTFTISNFGSFGTWLGTPIIKPPEVAILGIGRVQDKVVAVDGQAVVRPTLPLAVSSDHRLIDGHVMGAFVNDLQALLEDPVLILGEDN